VDLAVAQDVRAVDERSQDRAAGVLLHHRARLARA
jgi:hypothetical protein